ncbi:hypothetical protein SDC9_192718 [bioreactor metagenome]|uniref:Uncharacterized protein n=1 Tax=bioreactor metagenome TaxID=1076179 RepID=A0A645I1I0_9ZZZZ
MEIRTIRRTDRFIVDQGRLCQHITDRPTPVGHVPIFAVIPSPNGRRVVGDTVHVVKFAIGEERTSVVVGVPGHYLGSEHIDPARLLCQIQSQVLVRHALQRFPVAAI